MDIIHGFNIQETITSNSSDQSMLLAAAWMSIIFIAIEFIGLFGGFTLFHHTTNKIYITAHLFGIILTALFIGLKWPFWSYWFIFLICSLISGIIEIISIIKIIICQTRKY